MVSVGNLHYQGYPLINGATRCPHECGHVTFPGTSYNMCKFLVEMSTFKQAIKLTPKCVMNLAKGQCKIY